MSWWNPWSKKPSKIVAVIDIGSADVSAALVSIKDKRSEILFHTESIVPDQHEFNYDRRIRELSKAVKKTLEGLLRQGVRAPDQYVCFLSSSFAVSQTKTLTYREDTPRPLSQKMLTGILKRGFDDFYSANTNSEEDFYIIENKILEAKLDGYIVTDPLSRPAKEFKITQFLSGCPGEILRQFSRAIQSAGHSDKITFHTYTLASFSALRDYPAGGNSFISIDVGGELTDVLVSVNGVLQENISFPYGLNRIKRDLVKARGLLQAEITSHLAMHQKGMLAQEAKEKLKYALRGVKKNWLTGLKEALSYASASSILPEKIILTGDPLGGHIFLDWLTDDSMNKHTLGSSPFQTHHLKPGHYAEARATKSLPGAYLLMEAAFCEKIF